MYRNCWKREPVSNLIFFCLVLMNIHRRNFPFLSLTDLGGLGAFNEASTWIVFFFFLSPSPCYTVSLWDLVFHFYRLTGRALCFPRVTLTDYLTVDWELEDRLFFSRLTVGNNSLGHHQLIGGLEHFRCWISVIPYSFGSFLWKNVFISKLFFSWLCKKKQVLWNCNEQKKIKLI